MCSSRLLFQVAHQDKVPIEARRPLSDFSLLSGFSLILLKIALTIM